MDTEQQLLKKYDAERVTLLQTQAQTAARIAALDGVIASLRVVLGEAPAPARRARAAATGTKALILDVLADGTRRSCPAIAAVIKVAPSAVVRHLAELVNAGDVERQGKCRATTYGIR